MPEPRATGIGSELRERLEALGQKLGERERAHREALSEARRRAEELRAAVCFAVEGFHKQVAEGGAPHFRIEVGPLRVDDKHLRAVEFDLGRGRHTAIVTVKSRGEVTLVGPFRTGKTEGPCVTFPYGAEDDLHEALIRFLERFLEEAATP